MNQLTKATLIPGSILFAYGFLCRIVPVNFFWDSKTIGAFLLFLALLFFVLSHRKKKRKEGRNTIGETITISLLSLGMAIFLLVMVIINSFEAYRVAKEYIKSDPEIRERVGLVERFGLFPGGSVQISTTGEVELGTAFFEITVNGSRKHEDVIVRLEKNPETGWKVTEVR